MSNSNDGEIRVGAEVRVSGNNPEAIAIASAQLAQALSGALASAAVLAEPRDPVQA